MGRETRAGARAALNIDAGCRVVCLLGYIHARKGHALAVAALPRTAASVRLVFAGAPPSGNESFSKRLLATAEASGCIDRLRITGYLEARELQRWLLATDVAICPFKRLSASGSLSTWLSAGKPIVATDLPQMRSYNDRVPGALQLFRPYTARALATSIGVCLAAAGERLATAGERLAAGSIQLQRQLSLPAIAKLYAAVYADVLGGW